jgi:hypothetical protein
VLASAGRSNSVSDTKKKDKTRITALKMVKKPYHHRQPHADTMYVLVMKKTQFAMFWMKMNHASFLPLSCRKWISWTISGARASLCPAARDMIFLPAMCMPRSWEKAHQMPPISMIRIDIRNTGRRPIAIASGIATRFPTPMKRVG